jgi:hypothetical protein
MKPLLLTIFSLLVLTACSAAPAKNSAEPVLDSAAATPELAAAPPDSTSAAPESVSAPEIATTLPESASPTADSALPTQDSATPTANPPTPTQPGTVLSADGTSGIEGQATIGPTCPVVKLNQPCPDQPFQATLTVLTLKGETVIQFTTGADGKFHLSLAPGDYLLRPEGGKGPMRPLVQEQPFSVLAGQYTILTIQYDSGIR